MQRNTEFHIANLISKYLKGETTPQENEQINVWRSANEANELLWNKLTDVTYIGKQLKGWDVSDTDEMWSKIRVDTFSAVPTRKIFFKRMTWAAAIFLPLFIIASFLIYTKEEKKEIDPQMAHLHSKKADPSAYNKVQLILSNGRIVDLSENTNKVLSESDGTVIENQDQTLKYGAANDKGALSYNTIVIPRKTQYALVLADGTKVWLNAGSSLRFPTQFKGGSRMVYLQGEAYFEVAKRQDMPFRVIADETEIKVLGTHFNVMAYSNEQTVKTTLLEGSVNVLHEGLSSILVPGEQAQVTGERIRIVKADTEQVLAWKNGMFAFSNTDVPTIMRQIERWYDVEVVYQGKVPAIRLTGEISRKVKLNELVNMLIYKGIDIDIEAKTLHVKSK